jgi:hypothetical protein
MAGFSTEEIDVVAGEARQAKLEVEARLASRARKGA